MKIAILSCESSHAEAFAEIIRKKKYGTIAAIWDSKPEIALHKKKLTSALTYSPILKENLEGINFVLVEGRYADSHFEPAKIALENNIPVYIDKPTTNTFQEALELNQISVQKKVPLISFTPMVMGSDFEIFKSKTSKFKVFTVSCPAYCYTIDSLKAKDISFYASHGTDILTRLIRVKPLSVQIKKTSTYVFVHIIFENDYIGNLYFPFESIEFYTVIAMHGNITEILDINPNGDMYEKTIDYLFQQFLNIRCWENQFIPSINSMWILEQIKQNMENEKN